MTWVKTDTWPDLKKDLIFSYAANSSDINAFYTSAHYFTRFLLSLNPDTDIFFAFAQATNQAKTKTDLDAAAKKYGVSFDVLEQQWHTWAANEYGVKNNPQKSTKSMPQKKSAAAPQDPKPMNPPITAQSNPTLDNTINAYIKKEGYNPKLYIIHFNQKTRQITLEPKSGIGASILLRLP